MKLDPKRSSAARTRPAPDRQRVVAGREESGNAFLSGRELAIEDALASKAHIDALAVALRRGGLPGTLQRLRVLAFNDLTQGRHPLRPPHRTPAHRPSRQDGSGSPAPARNPPATLHRRTMCPAVMQARAETAAQAATTALTPATAMTTPAGTAAPTCPNGSTSAAAPPKTTTTRTAAVSRPARRPRSRR